MKMKVVASEEANDLNGEEGDDLDEDEDEEMGAGNGGALVDISNDEEDGPVEKFNGTYDPNNT